jgi:hypothetical protein
VSKQAPDISPWRSKAARKLVSYYQKRKKRALSGDVSLRKDPQFVAGNLLKVFGSEAHEKFLAARALGGAWPERAGELVYEAISAELSIVHADLCCCFCHRKPKPSEDLQLWLMNAEMDRWACPFCMKERKLAVGQQIEASN